MAGSQAKKYMAAAFGGTQLVRRCHFEAQSSEAVTSGSALWVGMLRLRTRVRFAISFSAQHDKKSLVQDEVFFLDFLFFRLFVYMGGSRLLN